MTALEKPKKKRMPILLQIAIGFALGIAAGLVFGQSILIIKPFGDLFIRLLRMLVVPLVFSTLTVGMVSIGDIRKMGRIGARFLILMCFTTVLSTAIGLGLALTLKPGVGVSLELPAVSEVNIQTPSILVTILEMVPLNPVEALAKASMLQIIVFAVLLGLSMITIGKKAQPFHDMLNSLADIMYKMTDIVILYAPYGVFALISSVVGAQGAQVLLPMLKLIVTVFLGSVITVVFVNCGLTVAVLAKMNPWKFFKYYSPAALFQFVGASSSATLPISLMCTQEKMGVSKRISTFVQSLGATVNMNGTSLYQGICTVFVAQLMGIHLTIAQLLTVVLTALLAAIGTAGVPGAGLVMLTMVLTSIGLPVEAIALIAGVDRILDSMRGVPNVVGDAAMALAIAKWEGEVDMEIWDGKKAFVDETGTSVELL